MAPATPTTLLAGKGLRQTFGLNSCLTHHKPCDDDDDDDDDDDGLTSTETTSHVLHARKQRFHRDVDRTGFVFSLLLLLQMLLYVHRGHTGC